MKAKELTIKQARLIKLTKEAIIDNKPLQKSKKRDLMIQAGYSPKTAISPNTIYNRPAIRDNLNKVITEWQKVRDKAIQALTEEKIAQGSGKDIVQIAHYSQKNINILSGQEKQSTNILVLPLQIIDKYNSKPVINANVSK